MKKYQLLESWQNGCDNAQNELFCESDNRTKLEEILSLVSDEIIRKGLGKEFPEGIPDKETDNEGTVTFHLGKFFLTSEHWRSFRIIETKQEWQFTYDEEYPDTAGNNFFGLLTDGKHHLFWHAYAEEEGRSETCHIYDSITMMPGSELCSYEWTADNDEALLHILNTLDNPEDYCGENCPLHTVFNEELWSIQPNTDFGGAVYEFVHENAVDYLYRKYGLEYNNAFRSREDAEHFHRSRGMKDTEYLVARYVAARDGKPVFYDREGKQE